MGSDAIQQFTCQGREKIAFRPVPPPRDATAYQRLPSHVDRDGLVERQESSNSPCPPPSLLLRGGGGSFFDQLGRFLRMRDVSRVARIHLDCLGIGALGHLALVFWIDRPVVRSHQVPTGFRLPSRSSNWRCE